jgi:hypothetical protein
MASTSKENGVPKFSRPYAFYHPLVKPLPSGTSLISDVVDIIYSKKKMIEQELEDRDYEMAFIKNIFEPKSRPQNVGAFFNFTINDFNVRLHMGDDDARFNAHVENLYSPNFFIKDYNYLVRRFGLYLNDKKLKEKEAYRDTRGHELGRYGSPPPSAIPERAIFHSYAEFKHLYIEKIFYEYVLAAYSMIIVITDVMTTIFNYWNTNYVPKYPQTSANRTLQTRYLPDDQNKPINVLKVYINNLNKLLIKLRGYKIILNPNVIKDINRRLNTLNEFLVKPDPSIANQANAKFNIRVLNNGPKFSKKQRYYSPQKKSRSTTQKRVKSH